MNWMAKKNILMVVLAVALVVMGYSGYNIYQKQKGTEALLAKAKEMQQKANEAFKNGQNGQAKLFLDSCEYFLNQIEE